MWTFTFPGGGQSDYAASYRLLSGWMNRRGGRYFAGAYVAVPELHPGGHGWHWHVLVNRRAKFAHVQLSWSAWLARAGAGRVNGGLVRLHVKDWGSSASAAAYASKYVSKSAEAIALGRHRYLLGQGVELVQPEYTLLIGWNCLDAIREVLGMLPEKARIWLSDDALEWGGPPVAKVEW